VGVFYFRFRGHFFQDICKPSSCLDHLLPLYVIHLSCLGSEQPHVHMPYPTYQKYSSFIMATLWNRAGHYIFALWFLSVFLSFFFSSPLCSAVSWPGTLCTVIHFWQAALAPMEFCRVQNSLCVHLRTIASFVGLYLQNYIMHGQSEKLVKQQYLLHMSSSYGELRPTNG